MTKSAKDRPSVSRRWFLQGATGLAAAPAIIGSAQARPIILDGITAGDVTSDSAVIWARADRISRLFVDWSTNETFRNPTRLPVETVTARTGHTGQVVLNGLPQGEEIFYRARFDSVDGLTPGATTTGRLRTAGSGRDVSFVFGGDQCGSGWGIDAARGGLRLFDTMRKTNPDFLVHLGDRIYADRPLNESRILLDGSRWNNIITPAKIKVAETLGEYRGNYSYNFLDTHYRRFSAEVPMMATWDDHEVANNWWPGRNLRRRFMQRKGYSEPSVDLLAQRGRQAFFDYTPMRRQAGNPNQIYRKISYGPLVDTFLLDSRSFRSANGANEQRQTDADAIMLGARQIEWLKTSLTNSRAVWKFIGNPLPIAHATRKKKARYDKWANSENGLPLGRELEMRDILAHIKKHRIRNVVWLSADVHYSAATFFDPGRAVFQEFDPFWEFTAGPFHTKPGRVRNLDRTFGPDRRFRTPISEDRNPPPSAGHQYFGHTQIDGKSGKLTVTFRDVKNQILHSQSISPDR
jgi:alkaline phosphatase D